MRVEDPSTSTALEVAAGGKLYQVRRGVRVQVKGRGLRVRYGESVGLVWGVGTPLLCASPCSSDRGGQRGHCQGAAGEGQADQEGDHHPPQQGGRESVGEGVGEGKRVTIIPLTRWEEGTSVTSHMQANCKLTHSAHCLPPPGPVPHPVCLSGGGRQAHGRRQGSAGPGASGLCRGGGPGHQVRIRHHPGLPGEGGCSMAQGMAG